ncbi:hypothetical protein P154DRAFT_141570 [Amniculicola lignicola CBS 123094]|uniref:Uncharacterized protein n=1 Tax=Amniculicola lignicola CBS 123094 TaxID=1392246 RepID=A0A6A5WM09_9PLEO|nr:hypothetical protein P154DRAFT_141570 [Amniculicola lignicola CBS 123094]
MSPIRNISMLDIPGPWGNISVTSGYISCVECELTIKMKILISTFQPAREKTRTRRVWCGAVEFEIVPRRHPRASLLAVAQCTLPALKDDATQKPPINKANQGVSRSGFSSREQYRSRQMQMESGVIIQFCREQGADNLSGVCQHTRCWRKDEVDQGASLVAASRTVCLGTVWSSELLHGISHCERRWYKACCLLIEPVSVALPRH